MKHEKRGRPLTGTTKRTHHIKVYLNDSEFKDYQEQAKEYKNYSPALSLQDIIRKMLLNLNDKSFQQFMKLDEDHQIKIMLRANALFDD